MIGEPSMENGISPAHVRAMGKLATKGTTSAACPLLTSMPAGSGVMLYPTSSRSPPKMISPFLRCRP